MNSEAIASAFPHLTHDRCLGSNNVDGVACQRVGWLHLLAWFQLSQGQQATLVQPELPDVGIRCESTPVERREPCYALPRRYNTRQHVDLQGFGKLGWCVSSCVSKRQRVAEWHVFGVGLLAWV